jgi:transglutaminase-like putative cysteine protease
MTTRIALTHRTEYRYDRPVRLGPQIVRLRPAPHCRTRIRGYSLTVDPPDHVLRWLQDPQANHLARVLFPDPTSAFSVTVRLQAELAAINPFDFFVEPYAERFPFRYEPALERQLQPFLAAEPAGPRLRGWLGATGGQAAESVGLLVDLNTRLAGDVSYLTRHEPGIQTCEETLAAGSGSCRDSGWLLVQILRQLGIAARFVSGYLIQLKPDEPPAEGNPGPKEDDADLHAWAEAYLPGAGWIGLDPTSGLLAGEGHVPLACTPDPESAAPIAGSVEFAETEFGFSMDLERLSESPG